MNVAQQTARRAGQILMDLLHQDRQIESKENSYNLVTEADLQSEKLILSMLHDEFPDHAVFAEESGRNTKDSEYMWVIDPLDGTNNYAHRFPFFAVSIALYKNRQPQLAVIYAPLHDEMYHAEKGGGAFLNNEKISVSRIADLTQSLLATGFYYERGDVMDQTLAQIRAFLTNPVNGVRRAGSACLDLCNVAAGCIDGYWELTLGPWDYAAGVLLVTEAGGKVSNVQGGPYDLDQQNILVSNGLLHEQMLEILNR